MDKIKTCLYCPICGDYWYKESGDKPIAITGQNSVVVCDECKNRLEKSHSFSCLNQKYRRVYK